MSAVGVAIIAAYGGLALVLWPIFTYVLVSDQKDADSEALSDIGFIALGLAIFWPIVLVIAAPHLMASLMRDLHEKRDAT